MIDNIINIEYRPKQLRREQIVKDQVINYDK